MNTSLAVNFEKEAKGIRGAIYFFNSLNELLLNGLAFLILFS
jgi:hypothetical protein